MRFLAWGNTKATASFSQQAWAKAPWPQHPSMDEDRGHAEAAERSFTKQSRRDLRLRTPSTSYGHKALSGNRSPGEASITPRTPPPPAALASGALQKLQVHSTFHLSSPSEQVRYWLWPFSRALTVSRAAWARLTK